MFGIIKWAFNIAFSVAIALVIIYFLPANLKQKILDTIDSVLTTPAERREEIINKLENNLKNIGEFAADKITANPNISKIIDESQKLILELKTSIDKNSR